LHQKDSVDTPTSIKRPEKRQRAHDETFADAANPLTRVIVAENYPDGEITAEQLTLPRGVLSKEIDGILEGPVPRFCGTYLKSDAAVLNTRMRGRWPGLPSESMASYRGRTPNLR